MSRAQLTSTVEQNTGGAVAPFVAGKNKIINGDFGIWQRGTSFSLTGSNIYTADRWFVNYDGSGATRTVSQQTFTPGSAPVAGYESAYFFRLATTVAGSGQTYADITQRIEDVRTFAGQTVTVSFWAKADSAISVYAGFGQNFGSGGSSTVYPSGTTFTLSTSWTRYTTQIAVPSVTGKTIGTGSFIELDFAYPKNATFTLDLWGVQVEAGSVATPFTTASGTFQGELALCQRYYYQINTPTNLPFTFQGNATMFASVPLPVTMRTAPTGTTNINSFTTSGSPSATQIYLNAYYVGNLSGTYSSATVYSTLPYNVGNIQLYSWSGYTTGLPYLIGSGSSVYVAWSAEL